MLDLLLFGGTMKHQKDLNPIIMHKRWLKIRKMFGYIFPMNFGGTHLFDIYSCHRSLNFQSQEVKFLLLIRLFYDAMVGVLEKVFPPLYGRWQGFVFVTEGNNLTQ